MWALSETVQSWREQVSAPMVAFTVIIPVLSSWPSLSLVTLAPIGHASPPGLLAHTLPSEVVPFPLYQLQEQTEANSPFAGPPWGWVPGASGVEAEVPGVGLPEGPQELLPWASSPGLTVPAVTLRSLGSARPGPPNPRGAGLEPALGRGSFNPPHLCPGGRPTEQHS